jgi:hypothetical protein
MNVGDEMLAVIEADHHDIFTIDLDSDLCRYIKTFLDKVHLRTRTFGMQAVQIGKRPSSLEKK